MLPSLSALLKPPFATYAGADFLRYIQQRTHVTYFALRDAEQASPAQIRAILENYFIYNEEGYRLPSHFDWTGNPSPDREWLILLHKFYFAPGLGEEFSNSGDRRYLHKWIELTDHWIDTVGVDFLSSDVTGRRVQNWIFAHYYFCTALNPNDPLVTAFYAKFLVALHQQVTYLCANLTPARNHRTIELYAIFLAAVVFPEFAAAADWLAFARRELVLNIQADLRVDGVHCEQSTDYHHLVLKNYLGVKRLALANNLHFAPHFDTLLQRALDFAMYAHRPDGLIPAFSDGDSRSFLDLLYQGYEIYGKRAWLYVATGGQAGTAPTERSRTFPAGGYTVLRSGWGENGTAYADERYLFFDCGPLGAGNHGHLDLLSFEAAAYGHALVVDPGRYTYHEPHPDSGETNWRAHFRGTAAHNTVQVDGLEQTRYQFHKQKFKVRGPEPIWDLCTFAQYRDYEIVHGFAASAEYEVIHERIIYFVQGTYWLITDLLHAPSEHRYDLRFHLDAAADGLTTTAVVDNTTLVHAPHLLLAQPLNRQTQLHLEQGFVSQRYGVKQCAPVVRFQRHAADTIFHTVLYPFAQTAPQLRVDQLAGQSATHPADARLMTSLRVTITTATECYVDTFRLVQNQHQITHAYEYDRQLAEPLTATTRPRLGATYGQVGRTDAATLQQRRDQ